MPDTGASAVSAGKTTLHASLRAVTKYLAPLIGFIAGVFTGQSVGGAASLTNATKIVGSSANAWRLAFGIMAAIFAGVGYIFWAAHHSDGWIIQLLAGITAGYFFGVAFWNLMQIPAGQGYAGGMIESLTNEIINISQGA